MTECMRFLRIGVINVLGITVPGSILILCLAVGFLFPVIVGGVELCQTWIGSSPCITLEQVFSFVAVHKVILLLLGVILAYIAGCIIRLSTADDLDRVSAKIVLKRMDKEAKKKDGQAAKDDHWPFQGEDDNKFPYFHFKDYLLSRGRQEFAELVAWGPPGAAGGCKRSKTHVNMMKLAILSKSPELSAVIESNEAHVRLMFGTWVAIVTSRFFVIVGCLLSLVGFFLAAFTVRPCSFVESSPWGMSLLSSTAILTAMLWAKFKIEHLFHYQRVRELFHIVACYYYAQAGGEKKTDSADAAVKE